MTDPKTILALWQYMVHADAQVLQAADTVSDEGYHREQNISAGSIHKLLVHCLWAQRVWLDRLNGVSPLTPPFDPAMLPRETIAGRWGPLHQELLAFAGAQTEASLAEVIHSVFRTGKKFSLPRGVCMLHVSDHATYHRGQLNSMIKLAGGTPSGVMMTTWATEQFAPIQP